MTVQRGVISVAGNPFVTQTRDSSRIALILQQRRCFGQAEAYELARNIFLNRLLVLVVARPWLVAALPGRRPLLCVGTTRSQRQWACSIARLVHSRRGLSARICDIAAQRHSLCWIRRCWP